CGPNASSSNQSKRIRLYFWRTVLRPSSLGSSHSNGTASGSGSFCDAAAAIDWRSDSAPGDWVCDVAVAVNPARCNGAPAGECDCTPTATCALWNERAAPG